jgi:ADP-ribose pyrophosphatase YjhB (NUDIX family)
MDITFQNETNKFKLRVSAIILENDNLLVINDPNEPFYYLPGGRPQYGETFEQALEREIVEELGMKPIAIEPILVNQAFYQDNGISVHELCMYFKTQLPMDQIPSCKTFNVAETPEKVHHFEWLSVKDVPNVSLFPTFLKHEILKMPTTLTLCTERQ